MDALRSVRFAWLLAIATPMQAAPADADMARFRPLIAAASQRCSIPQSWIAKVMQTESRGQTMLGGRPIRSRAGAMGLMQLMPATWDAMRHLLGLGSDPDDPHDDIVAGACYLRMMFDRFGYPGLFAAYNAGPGRYGDYLAGTKPLPAETARYLATVGAPDRPGKVVEQLPPNGLFFTVGTRQSSTPPPTSPLFVSLSSDPSSSQR